ncbi:MAG: AAA family ATPase [Proteobacteria bacterium]|nr:AAA family ATPase [Pseudomonadota bacterium]
MPRLAGGLGLHIRKLELHGFKSFPDRSVLTFGPGVSCIVGPNGCGKSNIVDALKWCMGEQSAKSLRGGDMLDVIFGGSAERAPMGFSEVSITFTAEEGEPFPGEYARFTELAVGRRLHRTGASEYFLGGNRCRRRDIVELFMDTGVGNNLYSFIEQGSIGKIVHASPAERRTLIDEAAGISKYKIRRKEAQGRLEATATQLDRASDVADEMGRRLKELERQVVRAARFRRMRAEQRQDEILLALAKYADLATDRRRLRRELREARGKAEQAERQWVRREAELAGRREELDLVEKAVGNWRDELAELDARLREVQGAQGFAERRATELAAGAEALLREVTEAVAAVTAAAEEEALHEAEHQGRQAELTAHLEREAPLREAVQVAGADRGEARRVLAEADGEVAALAAKIGAGKARGDALAEQAAAIPRQEAELRLQIDTAQTTAEDARAREAAVGERLEALARTLAEAAERETRDGESLREGQAELDRVRQRESEAAAMVSQAERAASETVDQAEGALREAEAEWARLSEERTRQRLEAQAAARRVHTAAVGVADRDERAANGGALRRSSEWLRAFERGEEQRAGRIRRAIGTRRNALEGEARRWRAEAGEQAEADKRSALQEHATDLASRVSAADATVGQCRDGLANARRAREEAGIELRDAETAVASLEGRVAAAEARLRDLTAAASGSGAVAEALSDLPTLGDLVEVDGDTASVLGDRLSLKVATDTAEVLRAAEAAREGGTGRALFVPRGGRTLGDEAVQQVERALDRVETLEQALDAFRFSGRGAVVVGTGEAVLSDGVVLLGGTGEGARGAADAREDKKAALADLQAARARVDVAQQGIATTEGLLEQSVEALDSATAALQAVQEQGNAERATLLREHEALAETVRESVARRVLDARAAIEADESEADRLDGVRRQKVEALRQLAEAAVSSVQSAAAKVRATAVAEAEAVLEAELKLVEQSDSVQGPALQPLRDAVQRSRIDSRQAVASARATLVERREKVALARQAQQALAEASRRAAEHRAEIELERARGDSERVRVRAEVLALDTRAKGLESRIADLHRDASRVASERAVAADALAQLQERGRVLSEAARLARATLDGKEGREEEAREALSRWQRERASLEERIRSGQAVIDGATRRVKEAGAARLKADERVAANEQERAEITSEAAGLQEQLTRVSTERAACWDKLERERERLNLLREAWHEVEEDLRRLVAARDTYGKEVTTVELRVSEVQVEVDGLKERIDERYQLSLPGLLDRMDAKGSLRLDTDPEAAVDLEVGGVKVPGVPSRELTPSDLHDFDAIRELVDTVDARREKIARLGDVHLGALEEYRDLEARHSDLVLQRTDLEESMARIRAAIAKMNRTSRQRFRDAFDRVDEHFQELYPRLVGGGRSRLSLTDEDDLLETGVDIFVQPPGKRLQNLTLLSGGEKAMSAIALLMALFKVRPSPFCVLDEVDAPLDEANGGRFNEMIREMSSVTQFLVVTHNKKTMESGDTLYGITMPTPGASRVVSVKIDGAPSA